MMKLHQAIEIVRSACDPQDRLQRGRSTDATLPRRALQELLLDWTRLDAIHRMSADSRDPADAFLADVRRELNRARVKFPGDRIMTIALAEEFGELAKAMLDESGAAVWKEAVQTAVMAARVTIDGDGSVDQWRAEKGLDDHRMGGHVETPRGEEAPCADWEARE